MRTLRPGDISLSSVLTEASGAGNVSLETRSPPSFSYSLKILSIGP
jgi:hypothetical protein